MTFEKEHKFLDLKIPLTMLRVRVNANCGIKLIELKHIASIVSEAPYTFVHLSNGDKLFCTQSIKHFDYQLSNYGFVRVHKSHLINVAAVSVYQPDGNGQVKLNNGQKLLFARGKKRLFLDVVNGFCL